MRDEAWRPFLVICGWWRAAGGCLPTRQRDALDSLSTAQTPQRQGRFTERAQLEDDTRLWGLRANNCAMPGPFRDKIRPARLLQRLFRDKIRPAQPLQRPFREKTLPARTKTPNLGCFKRAGRTFSRFRDDAVPQGELFRAQMKQPPRKPGRKGGGVWVFRTVCFERVVLSSPGCLWPV